MNCSPQRLDQESNALWPVHTTILKRITKDFLSVAQDSTQVIFQILILYITLLGMETLGRVLVLVRFFDGSELCDI